MIPLTPSLLIAAASSFIGVREQGGENRGQMVELFLHEVHQLPGAPWCAAFVHHVGWWSHWDAATGTSTWPLPATASCWELGDAARREGKLVKEPEAGDVFLLYSQRLGRFDHTGVVVSVDQGIPVTPHDAVWVCTTIEGNTNDDGSPNGNAALRKTRRFSTFTGDRFIRWVEMEWRQRAA